MSKGFYTFNPNQNAWNSTLYAPTPDTFLKNWEEKIARIQFLYANSELALRATFLRTIVSEIQHNKAAIEALYINETGLSKVRFESEFKRTTDTITLFANHIASFLNQKKTNLTEDGKKFKKERFAIGPVLILGSSNFPLAYSTIGGDTVAALAAGCCVIIKAHPMHVGTSLAVYNCIQRALQINELPLGIVSHVIDNTYEWAQRLASNPNIKAIGFTGSEKGGRALMDLVAKRQIPIPIFAEMGSLNPVIIDQSIERQKLAEISDKIAASIVTDCGQFCTKPGLLLIYKEYYEEFKKALINNLIKHSLSPMLHIEIFQKYESKKQEIFNLKGLQFHQPKSKLPGIIGHWCIAEASLENLCTYTNLLEEVFGPFSIICPFESYHQLQDVLNLLEGQLTTSLFTKNQEKIAPELLHFVQTKVGRFIFNGVPTGVSVVEAMQHGGGYPASSDSRFTAVGPDSILRFSKEICWQIHNDEY